jgi:hypothetical protein
MCCWPLAAGAAILPLLKGDSCQQVAGCEFCLVQRCAWYLPLLSVLFSSVAAAAAAAVAAAVASGQFPASCSCLVASLSLRPLST